jgi:hypothetical protein
LLGAENILDLGFFFSGFAPLVLTFGIADLSAEIQLGVRGLNFAIRNSGFGLWARAIGIGLLGVKDWV